MATTRKKKPLRTNRVNQTLTEMESAALKSEVAKKALERAEKRKKRREELKEKKEAAAKLKRVFERRIKALEMDVSSHTLAAQESTEKMLKDLKAEGSPSYEPGNCSVKMQIRMNTDFREAVYREAKKRKMNQSEFVRMAIAKMLPAEDRDSLADIKPGRPAEKDS